MVTLGNSTMVNGVPSGDLKGGRRAEEGRLGRGPGGVVRSAEGPYIGNFLPGESNYGALLNKANED